MRNLPIDATKIQLMGTGKCAERAEYVELSDGSRKRSGQQAKDPETGLPLFVVDVLVLDPESDRAEVVGVKVAAAEAPTTEFGKPVKFTDLYAMGYTDGNNRVAYSFRASGIEGQKGQHNPRPQDQHKPGENHAA